MDDENVLTCTFRFHFAQAVFGQIKKLGLVKYYRPTSDKDHWQSKLSTCLRQYLGLPILRATDIYPEVQRLEDEMRLLGRELPRRDARLLNDFHNYIIDYWFCKIGVSNISVDQQHHTTSNCIERYHRILKKEVPHRASIFRFLQGLITVGFEHAETVLQQSLVGHWDPKGTSLNVANKRVYEATQKVTQRYADRQISAQDVLLLCAHQYDDQLVYEALALHADDAHLFLGK